MIVSLPSHYASLFPLALNICVALAAFGLACSILALAWCKLPVTGSSRWLNSLRQFRWIRSRLLPYAVAIWWASITAMHLFGWQMILVEEDVSRLHLASYASTLIATLLAWHLWNKGCNEKSALTCGLGMQAVQLVGLACCANLFPTNDTWAPIPSPPGTLVAGSFAFTDKGTPIALYDREVAEEAMTYFYAANRNHFAKIARLAMHRQEAHPQLNCHGWVFSGTDIVKGEDVPLILKDNGYQIVDVPELNDLVIYSDSSGSVVHTGVVCGFLSDDKVLVEGKWGVAGTYMHLAEEQPYSPYYQFYRSTRDGHRLRVCDPRAPRLALGQSAETETQNHRGKLN